MPLTSAQFREKVDDIGQAIADLIRPVVVPASGDKAKFFSRYVFDRDQHEWAGLLKSEDSQDDVNAWLVSFKGIGGTWPSTTASAAPLLTYAVDVFYRYRLGTNEENSERAVAGKIAEVYWALALQPKLGLTADLVERHNLLQMQLTLGPKGAQETHKGFGTLDVQMARLNIR